MNETDGHVNQRQHERKDTRFTARVLIGAHSVTGRVVNISVGGAKIEVDGPIPRDSEITLSIEHFGDYAARVVWAHQQAVGIKFTEPPDVMADVVGAMALYGPA